jgi:hypothetical protein
LTEGYVAEPSLRMLVRHDDADCEFDYEKPPKGLSAIPIRKAGLSSAFATIGYRLRNLGRAKPIADRHAHPGGRNADPVQWLIPLVRAQDRAGVPPQFRTLRRTWREVGVRCATLDEEHT